MSFPVCKSRAVIASMAALVTGALPAPAQSGGRWSTHAEAQLARQLPARRDVSKLLQARCAASDEQLMAAIAEVHHKQQNVGVQTAIRLNGRLVNAGTLGYADRDRKLAVSRTTRFPLASLTKAFTGVATLRAVAAGRLYLDDPIQKYVPEFPRKPELTITARHLASHWSGIRHWGPERTALFTRTFPRLSHILPLFAADPLLPKAGEEYQYSSYGYNLLGLAIERATGTEFTRYVQREILTPLRLSRTRFDSPRQPQKDMAKLYSAYDLVTYAELPAGAPLIEVPVRDYSHNMAGGNMSSTAEDLARFGAALLRPGLLPPREYAMLLNQPEFAGERSPMSFGFFASDPGTERVINITGSNPGFQTALMVFPERQMTVVVLSNSWGFGSRSGDMVRELPKRLGNLCAPPGGDKQGAGAPPPR